MGKELWKPGNMVYPLPAVMVSCADKEGHDNIITIAWTGTICTNPAMLYISVRPTRYSYHLIRESGEFVVNLTTKDLVKATDWCGVRSGRDVDKWSEMHLTRGNAQTLIYAPIIEESPVNIECQVVKVEELGSHHMFLAKVTGVQVDDRFMQDNGKVCTEQKQENVYIIIECKKETVDARNAKDGVEQLKSYMSACPNCEWGMWTNGKQKEVFKKYVNDQGQIDFMDYNDIPSADGNLDDINRPKRTSLEKRLR